MNIVEGTRKVKESSNKVQNRECLKCSRNELSFPTSIADSCVKKQ